MVAAAARTALRHRSLGRAAMLSADIARTAVSDVDAGHHPALAGDAAVLVIADLANGGARRPRDVRLATGLTAGGVSNLLGRLEAWAPRCSRRTINSSTAVALRPTPRTRAAETSRATARPSTVSSMRPAHRSGGRSRRRRR